MLSKLFAKFMKKNLKQKQADTLDLKDIKNKVEPVRIGELGEYKINIQLDQLDKQFKYVSDLLIDNPNSKTRYSQIDHVVITPYAIFVIETKNYQGTIYGDRDRTKWNVNGKFPMMNSFNQNFGHIQAIKSLLK
ncbi:nuclease-related domain-containing protein, partial [Bacillus sp. JJ664]